MNYTKWIDAFMNAWQQKDVEAVMRLIAKDCKYYETVFDDPCADFEDIRKIWAVVPTNQTAIECDYKILLENETFCIVNFFVNRTLLPSGESQHINGIFQISLDENGCCSFFKQWREIRK